MSLADHPLPADGCQISKVASCVGSKKAALCDFTARLALICDINVGRVLQSFLSDDLLISYVHLVCFV